MDNKKISGTFNAKIPTYVKVYERLYDDVSNGMYAAGEQLPPETKLAEVYQVSRNTLRQAIAILCEDGLLYNVQGKGNFVSQNYDVIPLGFEKLDNPIFASAKVDCDEVKIHCNFMPPAKVVQEKLSLSASEITLASNNVYYHSGKPISHAFMEIPTRFISDMEIDLNNEKSVHELLNNKIFDAASTASSRITFSIAEESICKFLEVEEGTQVIFIEEIIYNNIGVGIALCKYYLLPKNYSIRIIRKK